MGKVDVGIDEHGGPPWWVFDKIIAYRDCK